MPAGLFHACLQCGLKRPFSETCNSILCRPSRHNFKGTEVPATYREQRFHHYTLKETEVPYVHKVFVSIHDANNIVVQQLWICEIDRAVCWRLGPGTMADSIWVEQTCLSPWLATHHGAHGHRRRRYRGHPRGPNDNPDPGGMLAFAAAQQQSCLQAVGCSKPIGTNLQPLPPDCPFSSQQRLQPTATNVGTLTRRWIHH